MRRIRSNINGTESLAKKRRNSVMEQLCPHYNATERFGEWRFGRIGWAFLSCSQGELVALSVRNRGWLLANTRVCGLIGMPSRKFVTFSANSVAGEKELRWVFD